MFSLLDTVLNFEKHNKIGVGGYGSVYEAFDTQLNAEIAIKEVPLASFTRIDDYFEESRKLYLTRHHNVVKINYATKDADFIYFSMPLYRKGSIKALMDSRFLTAREVIRYSLHFLSGLNNIHSKKLIHFDVKPENVLLSDSDQALISDFGLAQYTSTYGFSPVAGTTEIFAPPELFSQAQHNIKFDIYQAGITLYRMCNGDVHLNDQFHHFCNPRGVPNLPNFQNALVTGRFPDRTFFLPHIPRPLRSVVKKALAINPNDRYASVIDMLNDLSKIDKANDWLFDTDYAGNDTWNKSGFSVEVAPNAGRWDTVAMKNGRRASKFCKSGLTDGQKKALLYQSLNTNW